MKPIPPAQTTALLQPGPVVLSSGKATARPELRAKMRLAYTTSETPGELNTTLQALAEALAGDGLRAVGAVQINTDTGPNTAARMELLLLPDQDRVQISQSLGPGSRGCQLDTDALERSVAEVNNRLSKGADALIVNKFGVHESEGRGFREVIAAALDADVPVVVGVSEAKLPAFLNFTGPGAEAVSCDAERLLNWIRDTRG